MAPITRSRAAAARKTFRFPSLPTELRLMIWRKSFEPRILHITIDTIYLPEPNSDNGRGRRHCCRPISTHVRYKAREKPPIALQICHESRAVALKHYTPSFHSITTPPARASEMTQTALYFNPELDTVHIGNQSAQDLGHIAYHKEAIQNMKVLAIGSLPFHPVWIGYIGRAVPAFENLETLILVIVGESGSDEDGSSFRSNVENEMVQAKDLFYSQGNRKDWKLPEVKVMSLQDFESHL